jgi:N-acetylmuramoyl-L-alanine amidase
MKTLTLVVLGTLTLLLCSYQALNQKPSGIRKVVIDAGHGGKDPGCLGKTSQEKDIALDIALETGALIKTYFPEVKVIYTRRTDEEFVELSERARIANKNAADMFISVHCNASPSPQINGTETYIMGLHTAEENLSVAMRENAVILKEEDQDAYQGFNPNNPISYILMANHQNAYQANSFRLARGIESQFQNRANRHSRGVKQSGFLVLWKTAMPSVLVEAGYLTNTDDEGFLNQEDGRSHIASSLYRAFRDYKINMEGR